jgi:hypothetical protein
MRASASAAGATLRRSCGRWAELTGVLELPSPLDPKRVSIKWTIFPLMLDQGSLRLWVDDERPSMSRVADALRRGSGAQPSQARTESLPGCVPLNSENKPSESGTHFAESAEIPLTGIVQTIFPGAVDQTLDPPGSNDPQPRPSWVKRLLGFGGGHAGKPVPAARRSALKRPR